VELQQAKKTQYALEADLAAKESEIEYMRSTHAEKIEEINRKHEEQLQRLCIDFICKQIQKLGEDNCKVMEESMLRAIGMEKIEPGEIISSIIDDVFFIIQSGLNKAINSSSVDCICTVLNNAVILLETNFINHVCAPIWEGYPNQEGWIAQHFFRVFQGLNAAESGVERQRRYFLVSINNLQAAVIALHKLKGTLSDEIAKNVNLAYESANDKLSISLSQLDHVAKQLENLAETGIDVLCESAFRSRLKTNAEAYLCTDHCITEEELSEFAIDDPFMKNYLAQMDKYIAEYANLLTSENYKLLMRKVAAEAVYQFEDVVLKCAFNRLGARQLDREYRQMSAHLTSIDGWSLRESCSRIAQVVAILSADTVTEALEFAEQLQANTASKEILSLAEIKCILMRRVDFSRIALMDA